MAAPSVAGARRRSAPTVRSSSQLVGHPPLFRTGCSAVAATGPGFDSAASVRLQNHRTCRGPDRVRFGCTRGPGLRLPGVGSTSLGRRRGLAEMAGADKGRSGRLWVWCHADPRCPGPTSVSRASPAVEDGLCSLPSSRALPGRRARCPAFQLGVIPFGVSVCHQSARAWSSRRPCMPMAGRLR